MKSGIFRALELFPEKLKTKKRPVIYLDFENRPQILKVRGKDLGQNRELTDVYYAHRQFESESL